MLYRPIDRKHYPYDDYDKWLFGTEGLWQAPSAPSSSSSSSPEAVPDILVIQVGHATCIPSTDPLKAKHELHLDNALIEQHQRDVETLFDAVQAAVRRPTESGSSTATATSITSTTTTVIVSTASRVLIGNPVADRCTWKMNRIVARAAHKRGFVVFEREEMEHRVVFKSEYSEDLRAIGIGVSGGSGGDISASTGSVGGSDGAVASSSIGSTEPPTAHILATSLLTMIRCLAHNQTLESKVPAL